MVKVEKNFFRNGDETVANQNFWLPPTQLDMAWQSESKLFGPCYFRAKEE